MHVLLVNDDGPLDDKSCPYIKYLVDVINKETDWKLSIVVPNQQRSWIGKAHFAGKDLTSTYIYTLPSTEEDNDDINKFEGPFDVKKNMEGYQEWALVDSTPAACVDIGLNHLVKDVDLVLSGPNFGKNSSNLYILASGTVGSAMEGVMHNKKSIALSYSYSRIPHTFYEIKTASQLAVKLVDYLYNNWNSGVDLYSINFPLNDSLSLDNTRIYFAPILQNKWGHSIYESVGEHKFKWNPNFKKIYDDGLADFRHTDNRILLNNNISVTPLKAKFEEVNPLAGEIKLQESKKDDSEMYVLLDIPSDQYIYKPLKNAFEKLNVKVTNDRKVLEQLPYIKVFHYAEYEDIDVDLIQKYPQNYFIPTNIYRKALIRKNYLSNLIHQFKVKNPKSILHTSFPQTYQFELDYAEFLDDSLDECYELRDEINENSKLWILKPSMSDKGQGIRIFKTIDQLQAIFDEFEEGEESDTEEEGVEADNNGIITSQLRQFIVQEYDSDPLLLSEYQNRKFHFRVYVVASGAVQVFVYKNILTLFADTPFKLPSEKEEEQNGSLDMAGHLTNTCIQITEDVVEEFWLLKGLSEFEKNIIFNKICQVINQVFKAAVTIDKINFQPLINATEIYGVDFIIDSKLNVNLLEINAYPDFKQTGPHLKQLIDNLFESVVEEVIIPNMKQEQRIPKESSLVEVLTHKSYL